jgi:hypothetical protein
MEIVSSGAPQENTPGNVPVKVVAKLEKLKRRVKCEIVYTRPGLMGTLDRFELRPEQMLEQVVECWTHGKTPKQLESIFLFLMEHHESIVRGETPIPLTSKFRKLPFTQNKVQY